MMSVGVKHKPAVLVGASEVIDEFGIHELPLVS